MYDEYDDGEAGGRSIGQKVGLAIGVVAIIALGWFVVKPQLLDNDSATSGSVAPASASSTTIGATSASVASDDTAEATETTEATEATRKSTTTTVAGRTAPSTTSAATTTDAQTTTAAPVTTGAPPRAVTYDTLPNGDPVPVVVIYDVSQVSLVGTVPDQAAADRLAFLAATFARPGQGAVVNLLTLNPDVPRTVGVRVIELTSTRFPEGSAEVLPAHGAELDRVVSAMVALPKVTTLVIGHSDQRGDEQTNFALSEARAAAVVNYMASKGIAPSRLSSRAVGETDLLTLNNDAAALALNRRTEFVLYGLLIE